MNSVQESATAEKLLAGISQFAGADRDYFLQLFHALPIAIYTTDAEGRITFYNHAAAQLWGREPVLGQDLWNGAWKLFWPDGTPLPHDQCPMAVTLRTGVPVRGVEAIAMRPDGTRYPFIPHPTPLKDVDGRLTGAVNMLVDVSQQRAREGDSERLAAIVSSSDDAIISKDLNGVITSWNRGAENLFGYKPDEIIGKPVLTLIPPNQHDEEPAILARIRRGEKIDHYETTRLHKDGTALDISLTVSPLRNAAGQIVGASKIAHNISGRKLAEARLLEESRAKTLLLEEIQHRVKNTLGVVQAIATQTFRGASPQEKQSFSARIQALAAAHDLLSRRNWDHVSVSDVTVQALAPFRDKGAARLEAQGPYASLSADKSLLLSMVLHELGTNAVKYGALSNETGRVDIAWSAAPDLLTLNWRESGGPKVVAPQQKGFGSVLIQRALEGERGRTEITYAPDGVQCLVEIGL